MAGIRGYSTTAGTNTDLGGISTAEGWARASVNNAVRELLSQIQKLLLDLGGATATTGSANAYLLTLDTAPTAYANNLPFLATANHSNTGASTINLNSIGVKDIEKIVNGSAVALASGDLPSGHIGHFTYSSGNNSVVLLNPYPGASFQPLDADLTAIAAVATASYGRNLLALTDAAGLRMIAELVLGTDIYTKAAVDSGFQPLDADLTAIAALTTTAFGRSFLTLIDLAELFSDMGFTANGRSLVEAADYAAMRTLLGIVVASSGTYAPTLTGVANVATAVQVANFQYMRVGTVVTVSGQITLDVTSGASAATQLGISLPVASNFASTGNCGGVGVTDATQKAAQIYGDTTNDRAELFFTASTDPGAINYSIHFTYVII